MLLMVPHYDLDGVAFVDEHWTMRTPVERDAMILEILEEPSFVTEGGFIGWTEPLFAAADHILWLDPPLRARSCVMCGDTDTARGGWLITCGSRC